MGNVLIQGPEIRIGSLREVWWTVFRVTQEFKREILGAVVNIQEPDFCSVF